VDAFLAAVRGGDFDALLAVLDPDVVVRADRGAVREVRGTRGAVEHTLIFSRFAQTVQPVLVNGAAGVVSWLPGGEPFAVMCFTVKGDRIAEIHVLRDPDRLRRLDLTALN
jgi:hypothetical protein